MISKRFVVLMKKEKGFENINESIIRKIEVDGWKVERDYKQDFMLATSNKTQHIFRRPEEIVKRFRVMLSELELTRVKLIELSGSAVEEAVSNPKLFVND